MKSKSNIRYLLCYDTPVGKLPNGSMAMHKGKQYLDTFENSLEDVIAVCNTLTSIYGQGTHWIEDEAGEKVYPE